MPNPIKREVCVYMNGTKHIRATSIRQTDRQTDRQRYISMLISDDMIKGD